MLNQKNLCHSTYKTTASTTLQGTLPLSLFASGSSGIIREVKGKGETKNFLESLGFVENAPIMMIAKAGGDVIVTVKGAKIAISKGLATKVMAVPS